MLNSRCSIKRRCRANSAAYTSISLEHPQGNLLRNKKNLVRVRVLHFRSRREAFHIDVFTRGIGTLDQVRFARNGNSIRIISFCDLRRCGCWRRWWRCCGLHRWRTRRLNRSIRIEWLLRWRILFRLSWAIARGPMSGRWWLRLFTASGDEEGREQSKRQ